MAIAYVIIFALSLIMLPLYFLFIRKKQNEPWLFILFVCISIVNLGYLLVALSKTVEFAIWANKITYLGQVFVPMCMFLLISRLCGYEVVSMAYPCGGENNNDRVAKIIKENTGIKLARTITSTYDFGKQENLFRFNPTVYYVDARFEEIIDSFLSLDNDSDALLYIWGHSYEMDAEYITWEKFESVCKKLSGHNDIFYGTNNEVFFGN
jgi:hypothetical protein